MVSWISLSLIVKSTVSIMQENKKGTFNFVFVDGDKNNYLNYHKRVIDLVKVGGLIGYDNTLWVGSVAAPPDALLMDYIKPLRIYVLELNKYLGQDSRIEIFQLSVGDEITLCRRIIWSFNFSLHIHYLNK